MLVGAYNMFFSLRDYRTLWLAGGYGRGKTLLAFLIARQLVEMGYARYIVSNVNSVWGDDPSVPYENVAPNGFHTDTVYILDEGGQFVRTGADADKFIAALRKMNCFVILASVKPPAGCLRDSSATRFFNFGAFGIPLQWWKYTLNYGQSSGSRDRLQEGFWVWQPSRMYGIYDTLSMPLDDGAIAHYINLHVERIAKRDQRATVHAKGGRLPIMETGGGNFESLEEAAETLVNALSVLPSTGWQGNKRKGR